MANEQGYGSKPDLSTGTTQGKQDQSGLQTNQSNTAIKGQGGDLSGGIGADDIKGQQGYGSSGDLSGGKDQYGSGQSDLSGKQQDFDTTDPMVTKTPDDDGRQGFGDDKLRTSGQGDDSLSQGNLGKAGDPAEGKPTY